MEDDTTHLTRNREVVWTALNKVFPTIVADKIYRHWFEKHGQESTIKVTSLIRDLEYDLGINSSETRGKLRIALYECLFKKDTVLKVVPEELNAVEETNTPSTNSLSDFDLLDPEADNFPVSNIMASTHIMANSHIMEAREKVPTIKETAENIVFHRLYDAILGLINKESNAVWVGITESISQHAGTIALSQGEKEIVRLWYLSPSQKSAPKLTTLAGKKTFIHMLYIGMCEGLGPFRADAILGEANTEVSTSSAAQHFSPDQFL